MNNRLIVLSLVTLGATTFVSSAHAQGQVVFAFAHAGQTGTAVSRGGVRTNLIRQRRAQRFFAGSAFAPLFYSDYDSDQGTLDAPPPQIIVQSAQSASPGPAPKPPESLVLELQGDHWVRITNYGQSQSGQSVLPKSPEAPILTPARPPDTPRRTQVAEPPSELPPAVLVFRDGHKEEIRKYVIMGTTIYASADYWSSGSWTRRVQIAMLDIPATLRLNQERGAKFSFPSGPNEVMIRP